jgi:hypothetical protein
LSALADVEHRYETAHVFMEQWPGPADVRQSCLETLAAARERERGLLVRQLAELQQQPTPVPEKASVRRSVPDLPAVFVLEPA